MFQKMILCSICTCLLAFIGCSNSNNPVPQPSASSSAVHSQSNLHSLQLSQPSTGETVAIMKTTMGDIKIKFFPKEAPKAVENFIGLSKKGYYNGLLFHRVIKDFMIQGGDPLGTGTGGTSLWNTPFEDEFHPNLHNLRGALSMANSGPNTNGSQFFIVQKSSVEEVLPQLKARGYSEDIINLYAKHGGTPWLDNRHTVFGQVYEGLDIVDKIANTPVGVNDKPIQDVKITAIEITSFK